MDVLTTSRLSLVTMTPEFLRAEQTNSRELSQVLGAEIAPDWPPEHWEPHVFDYIQRQYAEDPTTLGWNRYVLLRRDCQSPVLIGTNGAFRKGDTEAELGYSIVSSFQRHGYATEATEAFMAWLFAIAGVRIVSAQTFPHLTASQRVMERCGMHAAGEGDEPGTLRYRCERP